MRNTTDVTDAYRPLIAVYLRWEFSCNYEIHGRKGEVLFFCSVPDTKQKFKTRLNSSSYPYPTKWGRYNIIFNHVVIKIRQLFIRPAAYLTSTPLETGVDANDCKCRGQRLNVSSEARRS
jgi:hypothetical protein